jgi:membrane-associated protease RseP (regulator of RpoE activity)
MPPGHDVYLSAMALAGWAGLLVTMINLLPVAQLDGGHIAYALWGERQNTVSRWIRRLLPVLAVIVGASYAAAAHFAHAGHVRIIDEALAGTPWLVWAGVLWLMTRGSGPEHPPTVDHTLSPVRRIVAACTLVLFVLLFMPAWIRQA